MADPKSSGYRGIHLILKKDDVRIEVQLRTVNQDKWANMVEAEGRALGFDFKSGKGPVEILELFRLLSDGYAHIDRREALPDELLAKIEVLRDNALKDSDR